MSDSANQVTLDSVLDAISQVPAMLEAHSWLLNGALAVGAILMLAGLAISFAFFLASKI